MLSLPVNQKQSTSDVRIGDVLIPYKADLEKVVVALVRDIIPHHVLIAPALDKLGIDPSRKPEKLTALLAQLLCYPRVIADHSFAVETAARARIDAGELLTQLFSGFIADNPPSTKYAASWAALYLSMGAAQWDSKRMEFLQRRFGASADLVRTALDQKAPGLFSAFLVPQKVSSQAVVLPALSRERSWRDLKVDSEEPSKVQPAASEKKEPGAERAAFYRALCTEISETTALVPARCDYHLMQPFFEASVPEVAAYRQRLATANNSFVLARHSRIVWEHGSRSEVIDEENFSPNARRNFRLETPEKLVFVTKNFGEVHAECFFSKTIFKISGVLGGDTFCIFDAAKPYPWMTSMEKLSAGFRPLPRAAAV